MSLGKSLLENVAENFPRYPFHGGFCLLLYYHFNWGI